MRILHVLQELGRGGAERMTAMLADGAQAAGHDVAVVAAPGNFADAFTVPVFALPLIRRRPHRLAIAALAIRRATRAWRPDLIHCHNPGMAIAVGLATGRGRRPSKVVTVHGVPDRDYTMTSHVLRWLAMPAVACGPGVAAALRERGLVAHTIQNGVSAPPQAAARAEIEREFPAARNRKLLVATGRLVRSKNFALLIRAIEELPDVALVIAGEGPLRASLERQAARGDASERITLAGYRADARALVGAADGVVITSEWEGLPLSVLEAIVAARPIVATRARWLSGVLTHERDCLLVEPGDPVALACAIARVVREPELGARLSANAQQRACAYTGARMVAEYLALYRAIDGGENV